MLKFVLNKSCPIIYQVAVSTEFRQFGKNVELLAIPLLFQQTGQPTCLEKQVILWFLKMNDHLFQRFWTCTEMGMRQNNFSILQVQQFWLNFEVMEATENMDSTLST